MQGGGLLDFASAPIFSGPGPCPALHQGGGRAAHLPALPQLFHQRAGKGTGGQAVREGEPWGKDHDGLNGKGIFCQSSEITANVLR